MEEAGAAASGAGGRNGEANRYARQVIFPDLGRDGQERLAAATVVIVGCGATGSMLAALLARAGVGRLRIVDRDFVELNNLPRQMLFTEQDIADALPKAEAAARHLRAVNSTITIEPVVADAVAGNILGLVADATVVLDGTDNFTTRYLINDVCVRMGLPWVYTGVVASYGMTATFVPDGAVARLPGGRESTGCLRCLLGDIPAPGSTPTCDTAGVLGPAVALVSSIAAGEAIKLLVGRGELNAGLLHVDFWWHEYELLGRMVRDAGCPVCAHHTYEYLDAQADAGSSTLCGRNAVQVTVAGSPRLDLAAVERQLAPVAGRIQRNDFLLRATVDGFEFTIFPDNRAIIKGTADEALARSLYARYVGN
ncbi:MAG: ThiF family adenylyltransferase [Caldilineaceae bacterium]